MRIEAESKDFSLPARRCKRAGKDSSIISMTTGISQMVTNRKNQKKSAGIILFPAFFLIFSVFFAPPVTATTISGNTTTIMRIYSEQQHGEDLTLLPFYEYFTLNATNLSKGLSVHLSGLGRVDALDPNLDYRADGDISYGYLEYRLLQDRLTARLGRQLLFLGAPFVRQLDGLDVNSRFAGRFSARLFAGSPVSNTYGDPFDLPEEDRKRPGTSFEEKSGDLIYGAKIGYRIPWKANVGVVYFRENDAGELGAENIGLDLQYRISRQLEFMGDVYFDPTTKNLPHAKILALVSPARRWLLNINFNHSIPGDSLNKTSIFSVFSWENHDAVGGDISCQATDRLDLQLDYTYHFTTGDAEESESSHRVFLAERYDFGRRQLRRILILTQERLQAEENSFFRLRGATQVFFTSIVFSSLDVVAQLFDEKPTSGNIEYGTSYSLTAGATLGYQSSSNWKLLMGADFTTSPLVESDLRGMIKFEYNFYRPIGQKNSGES